jgi:hypothetical protein
MHQMVRKDTRGRGSHDYARPACECLGTREFETVDVAARTREREQTGPRPGRAGRGPSPEEVQAQRDEEQKRHAFVERNGDFVLRLPLPDDLGIHTRERNICAKWRCRKPPLIGPGPSQVGVEAEGLRTCPEGRLPQKSWGAGGRNPRRVCLSCIVAGTSQNGQGREPQRATAIQDHRETRRGLSCAQAPGTPQGRKPLVKKRLCSRHRLLPRLLSRLRHGRSKGSRRRRTGEQGADLAVAGVQ